MMATLRSLFRPSPKEINLLQSKKTKAETAWAESSLYRETIPKYNPDDLVGTKGAKIYNTMLRDEQVKAVVKFKRDAITSRSFFFQFPEETSLSEKEKEFRIAFFNEMLDTVTGSFTDGLNYIMKAQWQGFSLTEKIFGVFEFENTPYIGLQKLSPKPYETFSFYVNEYGEITKVEQAIDNKIQEIDLSKFVYVVQNPDLDQHYGSSELREAYRSWYSKDILIRFYNLFMERLAGGFPVISAKEGTVLNMNSEEYRSLQAVLDHLQTTTGILLPAGFELNIHQPATTDQFERAIVMHDLQIAKALLVPNLLGITHTGQTGAYSQSQTQLEAFLWTLDADSKRLQDALNEQVFQPLAALNFSDGLAPQFMFKGISEQKKLELITAWKELVTAGATEASDTDEAHLRDLLDFPEKGEPIHEMPSNTPLTSGNQPTEDTVDREKEKEEKEKRFTRKLVFDRAVKRVAIAVIDRASTNIAETFSLQVAEKVEDLLAATALKILDENLGTPAAQTNPHELQFETTLKTKIRQVYTKALKSGWDLGQKHAVDEIAKARREMVSLNMARISTNATEFLRSNGFRLTGDLTTSMLKTIRGILANAVKYSWTPRETVRKVYDSLTLGGYVFVETNAEVTGRTLQELLEILGESRGGIHRIKTSLRTSLFEAINEARYSVYTDPELDGFVEALEYSAVLDSRTTDICTHLDDRVYPVDSPFWNEYRPPNHYNCRSVLVPVTIIDSEVIGKDRAGGGTRWSRPPRIEPQQGFGGTTG